MLVGKTGHGPSCKQSEINTVMVRLAREGKRVVRLMGSIYGGIATATGRVAMNGSDLPLSGPAATGRRGARRASPMSPRTVSITA